MQHSLQIQHLLGINAKDILSPFLWIIMFKQQGFGNKAAEGSELSWGLYEIRSGSALKLHPVVSCWIQKDSTAGQIWTDK